MTNKGVGFGYGIAIGCWGVGTGVEKWGEGGDLLWYVGEEGFGGVLWGWGVDFSVSL